MRSLTLTGDPERDPYPSVEDQPDQSCPYCECLDGEPHEIHCPMVEIPVSANCESQR